MYFEIEDYRPDISPVGRAISWREGVLLSLVVHLTVLVLILAAPKWLPAPTAMPVTAVAKAADQESPTFVFMQPRVDTPAPRPPDRGEMSDRDRIARAPERAKEPTNPLPFSRGNSPERVEVTPPGGVAKGQGPAPDPAEGQQAENQPPEPAPPASTGVKPLRLPPEFTPGYGGQSAVAGGALGNALHNLQNYVETQQFNNPTGGANPGASIQFDSKGVDFGPWLRRFVAQIRRNWFIPYAVYTAHGHTVVTFYVHKDGSITDLNVAAPSAVDAFNTAAVGALSGSNPTQPLPPEYPDPAAFFQVTFYYNEDPPQQ